LAERLHRYKLSNVVPPESGAQYERGRDSPKTQDKVFEAQSAYSGSGLVLILATAQAQQAGTPAANQDNSESAAVNAANNPTTPKLTAEAQDYWMPSVSGTRRKQWAAA
jgi:hypothetical protein